MQRGLIPIAIWLGVREYGSGGVGSKSPRRLARLGMIYYQRYPEHCRPMAQGWLWGLSCGRADRGTVSSDCGSEFYISFLSLSQRPPSHAITFHIQSSSLRQRTSRTG